MEIKINPERREYYLAQGYWGTRTLLDYWENAVEQYPNCEYVCDDQGGRLTYRLTDEYANRLACYLLDHGVEPGDVVAIQLPNWVDYCVSYVAALKIGAVLHLMSRNTDTDELINLMGRSQARALVCPTLFRSIDYEKALPRLREELPNLTCVVLADNASPKRSEDYDTLASIINCGEAVPPACTFARDADSVALLMTTSGTTGMPKIVMVTHNNILFSELAFNRELEITSEDVMFMPAPLHHATGFHHGLIAPMLTGARVVLQQKFERGSAVKLINREHCTYSMGATPFVYDILQEMEESGSLLTSMRFFLCGGAHVPQSLVARGLALHLPICEVYGSTESPPHTFVRVDEAAALVGSTSGRPVEGVEIRIVDEQGQELPPGEKGEELSRGPNVFVGYLGDPAATDRVLSDDGWFASGDLCTCDRAGNLKVVGRKKEILIRGGENLSIHRINETLEGCPGVQDRAIVGKPDPRFGERVCACIVPQPGVSITLQDLLDFVASKQVPKYLWPEAIEIVDSIPRTESGKTRTHLLRALVEERQREKEGSA